MNRQVLCIWLPNWPCQRVAVEMQTARTALPTQVDLNNRPFALQVHDPKRGLRIAAADPLARSARIMPGMSLSEATALLPELIVLPYEPQNDLQTLYEVTDAASEFSPLVGLELTDQQPWVGRHLTEPQSIFADVTNLTHFFGGPEQMCHVVHDWLYQKGYLAITAIAPSLGAAWAAANYGIQRELVAQLLHQARVNSGKLDCSTMTEAEPVEVALPSSNAFTPPSVSYCPIVWPATELSERLDPLDLAALRLPATTYQTLQRLGIRTIGSLRKLPRSGIAPRLGKPLLQRLDSVLGDYQEPIACYHAGPEFYVDLTLEVPTDRRDTVEELIRRLTAQLCQQLLKHGQGALRVLCRFSTIEHGVLTLKLGTYRPTSESLHLQKLLLGQFEQHIRQKLTLSAMSLQATVVSALRWQQTDLFGQAHVDLQSKTAELIDVLASRLGSEAVLAPQVALNPLPELTREFQTLTGRQIHKPLDTKSTRKSKLTDELVQLSSVRPSLNEPLRRPLSLLETPVQLDVLAIYPNGPPIRFRWSGRLEQVVRHWGPERIETGWWSGPTQRRDYYRVETESGAWLWLFRDLREHHWFLHGEFC